MKNPKVFFLALIGLIFIVLGFTINWLFIIPAVIIIIINQRELLSKTKSYDK
jgi:fumarate reductase subunit C